MVLMLTVLILVLIALLLLLALRLLLGLMCYATGLLFFHGFAKHAGIMLCVLRKVFCVYAIIGQLRIAVQLIVFLNDLLRRTAHFSLGSVTVEHAVNDAAA